MKMQLNITLKYLIMNVLTIKERNCLHAKKRHNIILKRTLKTLFNIRQKRRSRRPRTLKTLFNIS